MIPLSICLHCVRYTITRAQVILSPQMFRNLCRDILWAAALWIFCGALAAPSAARAVGDFQAEPSSGPRAMGTPSLLKSSSSSHRTERIKALDRAICYWLSETVSPLRHNFNGICTSRGGAGQSSLFFRGGEHPWFLFSIAFSESQPTPARLPLQVLFHNTV